LAGSLRASIYPVLRFTPLCSKSQDIYFNYSLAGPTFISKTTIDTNEIGTPFTFQDFMGVRTSADFQH